MSRMRSEKSKRRLHSKAAYAMATTKPQLILYGTDAGILERLRPFSAALRYIGYEVGYGIEIAAKAKLDALWLTPMAAVELYGANPPFPVHEAQVVKTPTPQLVRGFPRYGVVGVATSREDPRTPEFELRLIISALLKALTEFNSQSEDQIIRVGVLPQDLGLERMDPEKAFGIIRDLYGD